MTANLNINYRHGISIGSTVYLHGVVDRVEGRKIYVTTKITNPDQSVVYSDSKLLLIILDKRENNKSKSKL